MRYSELTIKRGATFNYAGFVNLPAGTWSASAHVKQADGVLVAVLSVTLTPPVSPETRHAIALNATASATANWPLSKLLCDVRFVEASGNAIYSPSFVVAVAGHVTDV